MYAIRASLSYVYQKGVESCRRCKRQTPQPVQAVQTASTIATVSSSPASLPLIDDSNLTGLSPQRPLAFNPGTNPSVQAPAPLAVKISPHSELVQAVWSKNLDKVNRLLQQGHDPNENHLLPRLTMGRLNTKQAIDPENIRPKLDPAEFTKMAHTGALLIKAGAKVTDKDVEEFQQFQTALEAKLTSVWNQQKHTARSRNIPDPGKVAFEKVAAQYEQTQNPYIRIILEEVKGKAYISSHERYICLEAVKLLKYFRDLRAHELKKKFL